MHVAAIAKHKLTCTSSECSYSGQGLQRYHIETARTVISQVWLLVFPSFQWKLLIMKAVLSMLKKDCNCLLFSNLQLHNSFVCHNCCSLLQWYGQMIWEAKVKYLDVTWSELACSMSYPTILDIEVLLDVLSHLCTAGQSRHKVGVNVRNSQVQPPITGSERCGSFWSYSTIQQALLRKHTGCLSA